MKKKNFTPFNIAEAMEDESGSTKPFNSPGMDKQLAECMSNSYVLSQRAWAFHWNYEGNSFAELHEVFGNIYDRLNEEVDELAERIRALGANPPSSLSEILKACSVEDEASSKTKAKQMVRVLEKGLVEHQECLRSALELAEKNKDEASIELLSRRLGEAEKDAWMLRSTSA